MVAPQRVPAGIRFKEAGKIYYFDAGGFDLTVGNFIVVDTSHGQEVGRVVIAPDQVVASEIKESLKPILRLAEPEDLERAKELKKRAEEQLATGRRHAAEQGVNIRVVSCDYSLDATELTYYFTAEDRVDFRPLARSLSTELDVKVHMLQIGERDRAKIVDGIGRCGERLCCSSWMTSFPTVSIKQAKAQDLPLNPSKLSGACGRLLCCLTYEYDQYREIKGGLPKAGARISTPTGGARVLKINVPKETITLAMEGELGSVEMPLIDFRLMYGTAIRPQELTQKFEKELMEKDVAEAAGAGLSSPSSGGGASPPSGSRAAPPRQAEGRPRPARGRPGGGQAAPDGDSRSAPSSGGGAPPAGSRAAQKSGQAAPDGGQAQQPADPNRPRRRRRRRGGRGRRKGGGGSQQS